MSSLKLCLFGPPRIERGEPANLALLAPTRRWTVTPAKFMSKSRNTPFSGWELTGKPVGTVRSTKLMLHNG